jgi:hypothetical protein
VHFWPYVPNLGLNGCRKNIEPGTCVLAFKRIGWLAADDVADQIERCLDRRQLGMLIKKEPYPFKPLIQVEGILGRPHGQLPHEEVCVLDHQRLVLFHRIFRQCRSQNAPETGMVGLVSAQNRVDVL